MDKNNPSLSFGFGKNERLCSRKSIDELFRQHDASASAYPLRILAKFQPKSETKGDEIQILISVPRRNFKRAVVRNLLKRRIREAYRLQKHSVNWPPIYPQKQLHIAFIYTAKEILPFQIIEKKLIWAVEKLKIALEQQTKA